jgi:hypothetical protein
VAVLSHLGDQNARFAAEFLLELVDALNAVVYQRLVTVRLGVRT